MYRAKVQPPNVRCGKEQPLLSQTRKQNNEKVRTVEPSKVSEARQYKPGWMERMRHELGPSKPKYRKVPFSDTYES